MNLHEKSTKDTNKKDPVRETNDVSLSNVQYMSKETHNKRKESYERGSHKKRDLQRRHCRQGAGPAAHVCRS